MKKTSIIIKSREYNGDYDIGSIFENNLFINLKQSLNRNDQNNILAIMKLELVYCIDLKIGTNALAKIKNEIPILICNDDKIKLEQLIKKVKVNPNYKHNRHCEKEFDYQELNYYDAIIDNKKYKIPDEDEILNDILQIFNYAEYREKIMNFYKESIKK